MDAKSFVNAVFDFGRRSEPSVVRDCKIHQKQYAHDLAVVQIQGEDQAASNAFRTGSPVEITWGRWPQAIEQFYGYVNHSMPMFDRVDRIPNLRVTEVVCVGASWVYKEGLQNIYPLTSTSAVIQQLAQKARFSADVEESEIVWPSLASAGMSHWQFLVSLAKRDGKIIYCNKTDLRCFDALTVLKRKDRQIPTFIHRDKDPNTDTILKFSPQSGDISHDEDRQRRTRVVQGVDRRTGDLLYATDNANSLIGDQLGLLSSNPVFSHYETDLVVDDAPMARQRLAAKTKEHRFYVEAEVELVGDTRVTQGTAVVLEGVGVKHSGVWYVKEATHHVSRGKYVLLAKLGRDAEYDDGDRPGPPVNVIRPRLDPYDVPVTQTPPTILANGVWRSAWQAKPQVVGVA